MNKNFNTLYHHRHIDCHSYRLHIFKYFNIFFIFCQNLVPDLLSRTSARRISLFMSIFLMVKCTKMVVANWPWIIHVNISEYTKPYTDSYLLNKYAMVWKCLIFHEFSVTFKKEWTSFLNSSSKIGLGGLSVNFFQCVKIVILIVLQKWRSGFTFYPYGTGPDPIFLFGPVLSRLANGAGWFFFPDHRFLTVPKPRSLQKLTSGASVCIQIAHLVSENLRRHRLISGLPVNRW